MIGRRWKHRFVSIGQGALYKTGPDVEVSNLQSIWLFRPVTEAGRDFIDSHVSSESGQWTAGVLAVEHRFAPDIVEAMRADGLEVEAQ